MGELQSQKRELRDELPPTKAQENVTEEIDLNTQNCERHVVLLAFSPSCRNRLSPTDIKKYFRFWTTSLQMCFNCSLMLKIICF